MISYDIRPPLTKEVLQSIIQEVESAIPVAEFSKKHYFRGSFLSLVSFVIDQERQKDNFSMNVGKFDPNFNPQSATLGLVFRKDNIWVKVRVLGGYGRAFRKSYMATQMGIARIDWKSKTMKKVVRVTGRFGPFVNGVVGFLIPLDSDEEPATKIEQESEPGICKNTAKNTVESESARYSARLSKMEMTVGNVLALIPSTVQDKRKMIASGEMRFAAEQLFNSLDTNKSGAMELSEFLVLFCEYFHFDETTVIKCFHGASEGNTGVSKANFIKLFLELQSRSSEDPSEEQKASQVTPSKQQGVEKAKDFVLSFYDLAPDTAHRLLDIEADFDNFARMVFEAIDEDESGTLDRREFERFFCGQLGMCIEACRSRFSSLTGIVNDKINYDVFAVFLKAFISSIIERDVKPLFWSRQVNKWLHMPSAQQLKDLMTPKYYLSTANRCLESLHTTGLTQAQMQLLDEDLANATSVETNEDPVQRFQRLAVPVDFLLEIPAERYASVVEAALAEVCTFKGDLDFVLSEEAEARMIWRDMAALTNCYFRLISSFHPHTFRLKRACPLLRGIFSSFTQPMTIEEVAVLAAQEIERDQSKGLKAYSRDVFGMLAQQPEDRISRLLVQEFRLDNIALSVFWMVQPYRRRHDKSTFQLYAGELAEAFGVSEEVALNLFDLFQEEGELGPRELVMILKDRLWAKIQISQ